MFSLFSCFRSRLRIWSRESVSVIPSRVKLLILHTQDEFGVLLSATAYIYIVNPHRVSPELMGSRNCALIAFTAESPLAKGQ